MLGAALLYADEAYSAAGIALLFMLSLSFATFIAAVDKIACRLKARRCEEEEFMNAMYKARYLAKANVPGMNILRQISSACPNKEVSRSLNAAWRRMLLGEDCASSLAPSVPSGMQRPKSCISNASTFSGNIYNMINAFESELEEKKSGIASAMQRYATLEMFLSTIAPSFIIFGFVGESIISDSSINIMLLSVIMAVILPSVYALLNLAKAKRFNG